MSDQWLKQLKIYKLRNKLFRILYDGMNNGGKNRFVIDFTELADLYIKEKNINDHPILLDKIKQLDFNIETLRDIIRTCFNNIENFEDFINNL